MKSTNKKNNGLLKSQVYPLQIPYTGETPDDWTPVLLFYGQSKTMAALWCQLSVLKPERWPHPPHKHEQEEVTLMILGEAEVVVPDAPDGIENRKIIPGDLTYIPSNFSHTNRGGGTQPANYLMMKWHSDVKRKNAQLNFSEFKAFEQGHSEAAKGLNTKILFKGQTSYLKSLNCHTSILAPGAGYKPHADDYDVIIIVLEGEVETLSARVTPYNVIYYAAGEPHGMHNPGATAAKYIVFEFHGWPNNVFEKLFKPLIVFFNKIADQERWKRKLNKIFGLSL